MLSIKKEVFKITVEKDGKSTVYYIDPEQWEYLNVADWVQYV